MKKFIREKAFTLVEILVVICIIGILTTMVLANYNSGKKQLALQRAANKLAQDIRRAQEMAMANTYMAGCFQDGRPHWDNPPYKYGFGIEVDTSDRNKYTIFADCKSDNQYKQQDEDFPIELPDFSLVEIDSVNSSTGRLDIVFSPPDPSVVLELNGSPVTQASIKIRIKGDPTKTKTITVNKVGLIEIQ